MFTFDKNAASKAGCSNFIDTTGYYTGKFTEAKIYDSKSSNAKMINFTFEAEDGSICYLSLPAINKEGKEIEYTKNMICAFMGIIKVIDDGDNGKELLNLKNKRIMLALQREEDNSKYGYKMNILNFFEPVTQKTYTELYNNLPAETVKRVLTDRKAKESKTPSFDDMVPDTKQDPLPWE